MHILGSDCTYPPSKEGEKISLFFKKKNCMYTVTVFLKQSKWVSVHYNSSMLLEEHI